MAAIEVDVEGTELFEYLVHMRIKDVRTVIGSLFHVNAKDVRIAFHPCKKKLPRVGNGGVIELHVDGNSERIIPYANQVRDQLVRQIQRLGEGMLLVSVPQQIAQHQTSLWQPRSLRV